MNFKPSTILPTCVLGLFASVSLPAWGQAPDSPTPPKSADAIKRQIPTNKKGIENAAATAKEALKPAAKQLDPVRARKLARMQHLARLAQLKSTQFKRDLAAGKVQPWQHLRQQFVEFQKSIPNLASTHKQILSEDDPSRRAQLIAALQLALQPIGPYLRAADARSCDLKLTPQKVAEYHRLEAEMNDIEPNDNYALTILSPSQTYTLLDVPVTLKMKAPAGASIYLESHGGGKFPNGMTIIKITADDNGIATTEWFSQGDAIGPVEIEAISPQAGLPIYFEMDVVKLQLIKIPDYQQALQILKMTKKLIK